MQEEVWNFRSPYPPTEVVPRDLGDLVTEEKPTFKRTTAIVCEAGTVQRKYKTTE